MIDGTYEKHLPGKKDAFQHSCDVHSAPGLEIGGRWVWEVDHRPSLLHDLFYVVPILTDDEEVVLRQYVDQKTHGKKILGKISYFTISKMIKHNHEK